MESIASSLALQAVQTGQDRYIPSESSLPIVSTSLPKEPLPAQVNRVLQDNKKDVQEEEEKGTRNLLMTDSSDDQSDDDAASLKCSPPSRVVSRCSSPVCNLENDSLFGNSISTHPSTVEFPFRVDTFARAAANQSDFVLDTLRPLLDCIVSRPDDFTGSTHSSCFSFFFLKKMFLDFFSGRNLNIFLQSSKILSEIFIVDFIACNKI